MRKVRSGLTMSIVCAGLLWAGVAVAALDPVVKCQADKVKAGGKRAQCLANEQAKKLKGKPFDTQKCEDKFVKAIAKADKKGAACGFVESQCQVDLTQSQDNLATCNTNLETCNADLAACEASAFVPQTGQTTCWDPGATTIPVGIIPCANTGQDGDVQAGVVPPGPRFMDNGDGTDTDNLTGLI